MTQSTGNHRVARNRGLAAEANPLGSLWHRLRGFLGARNGDHSLRETIEEIIEEIAEEEESTGPIGEDERVMLANILKLRHVTAYDVMVPRADIVAVDSDTGLDGLIEVTHRFGHSRFPVYRESLDDVAGLVHIKDLLPYAKGRKKFNLTSITRTVLFVAPSMRVLA